MPRPTASKTSRPTSNKAAKPAAAPAEAPKPDDLAAELSYAEAHAALELALAQLQDSDLPVEEMADLYQRARAFAARCEHLLNQVEQTVELWDAGEADASPRPFDT